MVDAEVHDPLEELQRENEVIENLLLRILEEAEILKSGKNVASGEISEGLRLLDQYLDVHAQRLDKDLMTFARGVAMPGCFPHLDRIVKDHEEAKRRTREARVALQSYEQGIDGARAHLADVLEAFASKGHENTVYEGDYPLSCLVTALPPETSEHVAERFEESSGSVRDLEAHIQGLLSTPVGAPGAGLRVRCVEPGCSATAEAHVVPGNRGRLGLQAPVGGWRVSAQAPEIRSGSVARVRVDFRCPSHPGPEPDSSQGTVALSTWAEEGGWPAPPNASDRE